MSTPVQTQVKAKPAAKPISVPVQSGLVLRKCACGESAGIDGECSECREKKLTVQRRAINEDEPSAVPHDMDSGQNAQGQAPGIGSRADISPGRGFDFSRVRVYAAPERIQTKLMVNEPGDKYEQEADAVAEQVMRMTASEDSQRVGTASQAQNLPIRRLPLEGEKIHRQEETEETEEEDEEETLQAKEGSGQNPEVTSELQTRIDSIKGGGQPLPEATRAFMEPRFGYDFSHVRIHTDAQAVETARAVNAKAYTVGRDIVFGTGQYKPGTTGGKRLLAHELTHMVQQDGRSRLNPVQNHQSIQRQPAVPGTPPHSPWDDLPANARQAIDKTYFNEELKPESQSAFRSVYSVLVSEGLWDEVVHVVNVYPKNVRGIEAIAKTSLSGRLLSHPHLCRDTQFGGSKHSGAVMWRQLVQAGTEGLHVGVSSSGRMVAHLDTLAPVDGREANGECRYSMPHILSHAQRDLKGWRNLEFFPAPTGEPKPGEVQPDVRISIPGT